MTDNTTAPDAPPFGASAFPGVGPPDVVPGVVVLWCTDQRRIGESALLPDLDVPYVMGRGDGDGTERRILLSPRRPGEAGRHQPLRDNNLSRRQLVLIPRTKGFDVELVGGGALRLARVPARSGFVPFDETIYVENRVLLLATCIPRTIQLRHYVPGIRGEFGAADDFEIVGESSALYQMYDRLEFIAGTSEHLLLNGESGSGKESAARVVHLRSKRAHGPFVRYNCATLPQALGVALLVGNKRNYPNAGMGETIGLFAEASGGTLFLDEIGDLHPELQAALLRALDKGGEYRRLGESHDRFTDMRVIGATNRDLSVLRPDLFGRFKRRIDVPPLRERLPDIALLVLHLVRAHARKSPDRAARFLETTRDGSTIVRIHPALLELLVARDYPLNVRELDDDVFTAIEESPEAVLVPTPSLLAKPTRSPEPRDVSETEEQLLRRVVDGSFGCRSKAARLLGRDRFYVRRRLKQYGIVIEKGEDDDDERE